MSLTSPRRSGPLVAKLPPLLDRRNVRHAVRITRCRCGCVLLRSDDDPSVTWTSGDWESEDQLDPRCSDRGCFCHRSRIIDLRGVETTILVLGGGPREDAKETSSAL
jgi:hypothetical protein